MINNKVVNKNWIKKEKSSSSINLTYKKGL